MRRKLSTILIGFIALGVFFTNNCYIANALEYNPDVNGDGVINELDLNVITGNYGSSDKRYDLNNDGIVDIYDTAIIARQIDDSIYKVYNSKGNLVTSYGNGDLHQAINSAYFANGKVVSNSSGQVIWDKSSYWTYDGETVINKYASIYDSINNAINQKNGRVYSKYGTEYLNNTTNYKSVLGVVNINVNFRDIPSTQSPSVVIGVVPNGTIVNIVGKNNGFYKVKWYKEDSSIADGYIYGSYLDIIQDDKIESNFGYIAARYESNMNVGAIADNPEDKGGASFGMFQLAANTGSVTSFMLWLQNENASIYNILNNARIADDNKYGENYKIAWKDIANNNYEEFYRLQLKYVKGTYYDGFMRIANNNGYNPGQLLNYSATRNMIFSTAIQHGATGAYTIIHPIDKNLTLNDFIDKVYSNRLDRIGQSYEPTSNIYLAVKNRYINESADIKRSYSREISY